MFLIIFIIVFFIFFITSKIFFQGISNIKIILLFIFSILVNSLFLNNIGNIGQVVNIEGAKNISITNEIKVNYDEYIKTGKLTNKLEDNDNLVRLPTFKEIKYYSKIALFEEISKILMSLISILLFYIFINKKVTFRNYLGIIFIGIFSFFIIENLLYFFGSGGSISTLLLRSINPTHYIFFITLLGLYHINNMFSYKNFFISLLVGITFHFVINISITANWLSFSFFLIMITLFISLNILGFFINEN